MEEKPKKKRGAPKGNRNASRIHYYVKELDETEQKDFDIAVEIEGIDEEIGLLRQELKRAITGGDERNLLLIVKASNSLEKLIRTRYQITAEQRRGLKEMIAGVIQDVFVPLGVNVGTALLTKKIAQ
jgi:hypothetical protein